MFPPLIAQCRNPERPRAGDTTALCGGRHDTRLWSAQPNGTLTIGTFSANTLARVNIKTGIATPAVGRSNLCGRSTV